MITIWRSMIWRSVGVVILAAGVTWLLPLLWTGCVARNRTVNRTEIPEHIVGEVILHSFELAGYTDEGISVRQWNHTIGYSAYQIIQIDMDGRRTATSPESQNLILTEGQHLAPLVKELASPDGRYMALITSSGGTDDYYWLELRIRDNTTLAIGFVE